MATTHYRYTQTPSGNVTGTYHNAGSWSYHGAGGCTDSATSRETQVFKTVADSQGVSHSTVRSDLSLNCFGLAVTCQMFGVGTFANGELREAHNFSSCP